MNYYYPLIVSLIIVVIAKLSEINKDSESEVIFLWGVSLVFMVLAVMGKINA